MPQICRPLPEFSDALAARHARRRRRDAGSLRAAGASDAMSFARFVIPIPVTTCRLRPGGGISAGQTRRSCITPTSRSIARGCRGGATTTSRAPGTKAAAAARRGFPTGCFSDGRRGSRRASRPKGMSWHLEPHSDLVVELHLMPGDDARACAGERRILLHRRAPVANRLHAEARAAGHRYRRRPPRLRQRRRVHAAGRRRRARRATARAFSREGRSGVGDAARWRDRAAHPHQGLGFPLAGRLHVRAAAAVAEGHRHRDALHVRQLRGESRESESASQARDVRSDQRVGDGIVVAAGGAARPGRSRAPRAGLRRRRFCATTSQATRSGSRSSRATRSCVPSSPRAISKRIASMDALVQLSEAARLDPTAGRHYDVGRVLLIQQEYERGRSVVPTGAGPEARVCRGALRPRRRPARAAQSGRRDRVVRAGAGRRPVECRGSLQPRARVGRARPDRSRDSELSESDRAVARRCRCASGPRARARACRISSPKRSIAIAARSKSSPIAWARCWIWRGLSRRRRIVELRVPAEGVRLAERAVALPTAECHGARHAGGRLCRGRPDRAAVETAENAIEGCAGSRRSGARRADSRAARAIPRDERFEPFKGLRLGSRSEDGLLVRNSCLG